MELEDVRDIVDSYLHSVALGDDGWLHLHGPEPDCPHDLARLRWGCLTLLATSVDDELVPLWQTVLRDLVPVSVSLPPQAGRATAP